MNRKQIVTPKILLALLVSLVVVTVVAATGLGFTSRAAGEWQEDINAQDLAALDKIATSSGSGAFSDALTRAKASNSVTSFKTELSTFIPTWSGDDLGDVASLNLGSLTYAENLEVSGFANLTALTLPTANEKLKNLTLKGLDKLAATSNPDVTSFTKLESLTIDGAKVITGLTIPASNATIKSITIKGADELANGTAGLVTTGLTALETLVIDGTKLPIVTVGQNVTTAKLTNLTKLGELSFVSSAISSLDLTGTKNITSLTLTGLSRLTEFEGTFDKAIALNIQKNGELAKLALTLNKGSITATNVDVTTLPKLTDLTLVAKAKDGDITLGTLEDLDKNILSLKKLSLEAGNEVDITIGTTLGLKNLESFALKAKTVANNTLNFSKVPSLNALNLQLDELSSLNVNGTKLTTLDLSKVEDLTGLTANEQKLTSLVLSKNRSAKVENIGSFAARLIGNTLTLRAWTDQGSFSRWVSNDYSFINEYGTDISTNLSLPITTPSDYHIIPVYTAAKTEFVKGANGEITCYVNGVQVKNEFKSDGSFTYFLTSIAAFSIVRCETIVSRVGAFVIIKSCILGHCQIKLFC
ncbi:hypothetical protein FACS1894111_12170 [Clostridia bacterium]|nr:hypothetical protein FACS1894111_12170 [Clostridia bacterium]